MAVENIIIARKWSGLEWGARQQGKNLQEAIEDENHLGMDTDIVKGHDRQMEALDYFMNQYGASLGNPQLLVGDDLDKDAISRASLVIVLGGDNYFQHVSHFIGNQLTLGINNDVLKSTAAFAHFNTQNFADFLPILVNGDFNVEEWTRLETIVNGQILPVQAISEVAINTIDPDDMNRYEIVTSSGAEIQKTSGILVATYYGSQKGSWSYNESQYLKLRPDKYDLIVRRNQARFIGRAGDLDEHDRLLAKIQPGQKLEINWLAHGEGGVKADPKHGDPFLAMFTRGGKIEVEISDKLLKVVLPN